MTAALHQATAVAIEGRGLLIEGAPGTGKSSLALALIDRGAVLIGDDGVLLERQGERLLASPAPVIAGKLEIRNLGLLVVPTVARAPVSLVITLDAAAPRFREGPDWTERAGILLPHVALTPDNPVIALRAEWALREFGLA